MTFCRLKENLLGEKTFELGRYMLLEHLINMKKTHNKSKDNPLYLLEDIEESKVILSKQEIDKLEEMFESIDNFNVIFEFIEENIVKKGISEHDLLSTYNIITKTLQSNHQKTGEKIGYTQIFFEIPEILSRKLRTIL